MRGRCAPQRRPGHARRAERRWCRARPGTYRDRRASLRGFHRAPREPRPGAGLHVRRRRRSSSPPEAAAEERPALHPARPAQVKDIAPAAIAAVSRDGAVAVVASAHESGPARRPPVLRSGGLPPRNARGGGHGRGVRRGETTLGVVYSPSGAQAESETHVFDLATGKRRRKLPVLGTTSIAFDPSGGSSATASSLWSTSRCGTRAPARSARSSALRTRRSRSRPTGGSWPTRRTTTSRPRRRGEARSVRHVGKGPPRLAFLLPIDPLIAFSADGSRVLAIRGAHATLFGASRLRRRRGKAPRPARGAERPRGQHPGRSLVVAGTRSGALYLLRLGTDPAARGRRSPPREAAAAACSPRARGGARGRGLARGSARCAVQGTRSPLELCQDEKVVSKGLHLASR